MTTRRDISTVPLQSAYVARQCPVRAENDVLLPSVPVEHDAFARLLIERGNSFEREIVIALIDTDQATAVIEGDGPSAQDETIRAMARGEPLILNGRIVDEAGHRVGRPDLLVRADDFGGGPGSGYRAVDIKSHGVLKDAEPGEGLSPALVCPLTSVALGTAMPDPTLAAEMRENDVLQLAHYQRILEEMGFAASEGRFAGTIGTERLLVWHDLDAQIWRTPSHSAKSRLRSAMERYDFEFDFRLDIIAVAMQHRNDPSVDLLVVPVRCDECPKCPWSGYCMSILETPPGDLSLLPRIGWSKRKVHHDHGVTNISELAALDVPTAELVSKGVDVERLLWAAEMATTSTPVEALAGVRLRAKGADLLEAAGISTAGDLSRLCRKTAGYSRSGLTALPRQIELARATLGPAAAYPKAGVAGVNVPRADLEVDVDMESVPEGCYMWGCLVTDRTGVGLAPTGYTAFVTWEPLNAEVELANSLRFWRWLMDLRESVLLSGRTFNAYCFSAGAENRQLRRLGDAGQIKEQIDSFISSGSWVDMMTVWDSQLITGGSVGLKAIAPLAGYEWPVDDPGGSGSMVMYDAAVDGGPDGLWARQWLLDYNRGDVEATCAVREWMDLADIPSIEGLDP